MRKNRSVPRGTVHRLTMTSKVLAGNLQGDPVERELHVYTPAGYKEGTRLPLLVDVVGFTASGMAHTNWKAFTENVPERLDRLIGEGKMGPAVVAFPDCYSRLGGNQYVNSTACAAASSFSRLRSSRVMFVTVPLFTSSTSKPSDFTFETNGTKSASHSCVQ